MAPQNSVNCFPLAVSNHLILRNDREQLQRTQKGEKEQLSRHQQKDLTQHQAKTLTTMKTQFKEHKEVQKLQQKQKDILEFLLKDKLRSWRFHTYIYGTRLHNHLAPLSSTTLCPRLA